MARRQAERQVRIDPPRRHDNSSSRFTSDLTVNSQKRWQWPERHSTGADFRKAWSCMPRRMQIVVPVALVSESWSRFWLQAA